MFVIPYRDNFIIDFLNNSFVFVGICKKTLQVLIGSFWTLTGHTIHPLSQCSLTQVVCCLMHEPICLKREVIDTRKICTLQQVCTFVMLHWPRHVHRRGKQFLISSRLNRVWTVSATGRFGDGGRTCFIRKKLFWYTVKLPSNGTVRDQRKSVTNGELTLQPNCNKPFLKWPFNWRPEPD